MSNGNAKYEVMEMKIVDELLEMYAQQLTGDDEDADFLAFSVLEQLSYQDVMDLIKEMDQQEVYDMVGYYMIELLKGKMAERGISKSMKPIEEDRIIH